MNDHAAPDQHEPPGQHPPQEPQAAPIPDPIPDQLQAAISHHQAKRFEPARQAYLAILQSQPYHALANHNLGLLSGQLGDAAAGLPYLRTALSVNPDEGQFWLSYADGLLQAGQPEEALEIVTTAIQRGLDNPASQALLQAARTALERARQAPSQNEMAALVALFQTGQYAQLESATRALLATYPDSAFGWSVLGTALQVQGKDALAVLEKTVALAPDDAEAHGNLANALQQRGRHEAAVASYGRALELAPGFAAAHSNLGGALQALGHSDAAVLSYRRALELQPDHAIAHFNLGNSLKTLGQLEAALASYTAAAALTPDDVETHLSIGEVLQALKQDDTAAASYRRVLALQPDHVQAHAMLGVCLQNSGELEAALLSHRRALELDPARAETRANIGLIEQRMGRLEQAIVHYREVLVREPESALIHTNLGTALQGVGNFEEALACHRRAIAISPEAANAHANLGTALQAQGQLDEAVVSYRRAIELEPLALLFHKNLTSALQNLRRHDESLAAAQVALALAPDDAVNHFNLGNSLRALQRTSEGIACFERAIELDPAYSQAYSNLGAALQDSGRIEEALAACRQALALRPDLQFARSNLLFCMLHSNLVSPEQVFEEHRRFGTLYEAGRLAQRPPHRNGRDPERPLQVGFVSGDFNNHAVANFVVPVLAHLAQTPGLVLHGYYTNTLDDVVTARLRGYLRHWHEVAFLSNQALAERIEADGIDILVDLSGHTAKNRLRAFAYKPAPLQASWIGYPGTTGLAAMDYYFSDRYFSPPGLLDDQFTEKLVCLPASIPFLPAEDAGAVEPAPVLANGHLTFGSFNRPSKLSRAVIARWAKLLRAVPDARMLVAAMPADDFSDVLRGWFAAEGVAAERLSFHPRASLRAYFALHGQVDVCLDSFPYNGGTTTLNALWMGVPTLTMAGPTLPSRAGACIMEQIGLDAFVATDDDDFVQKGRFVADNPLLIGALRLGMRRRLEQAPMGQPALIASGLEHAMRFMWQRWCAGLPPVPFEITGAAAGDTPEPII